MEDTVISNQCSVIGNQCSVISEQLPTTDHRLPITDYRLQDFISRQVQNDVVELGLPRALQLYIDGIRDTVANDAFTLSRLDDLIRAASQFTGVADSKTTLTDFTEFVMSFKTRAVADASVVKILTIHRSKGLGFDFVILPVMDGHPSPAMDKLRSDDIFEDPDGHWVLDRPPPAIVAEQDATLLRAVQVARSDEAFERLCGYYVGMTRAIVAMKVLLCEEKGKALRFSSYVANVCGELPYAVGNKEWWKEKELGIRNEELGIENAGVVIPHSSFLIPNSKMRRVTPSTLHVQGGKGSQLFGEGMRKGAAKRGTELHALLQQVEWVDSSGGLRASVGGRDAAATLKDAGIDLTAPSSFAEALKKPKGFVELWRERSFEIVDGDTWMSGTFDRVVFTKMDGELHATVYDYKTNRRQDGETAEAFTERMRVTYASQMNAYRAAVSRLTAIPVKRIRTVLLLSDIMKAKDVD